MKDYPTLHLDTNQSKETMLFYILLSQQDVQ